MSSGLDPTKVPSVTPPTGVTPNFDNPPSKAFIYYIVASISTALMTFFVILRLYVRSRITRALWWDDRKAPIAVSNNNEDANNNINNLAVTAVLALVQ
jgi:hypothetical protein